MVATSYQAIVESLRNYGVLDFLLPFILVFTIVFAVMQKTKILGDKKQFNVIIAMVLGLLFVVPHMLGTYPLGYDPVVILNQTLPSISLVSVAAIMLLLLMGIFGTDFSKNAAPIISLVAVAFVVYIFGAALNIWQGPYDVFSWWSSDVTELIIILLVFGLIVRFITADPDSGSAGEGFKNFAKSIGELFEKNK